MWTLALIVVLAMLGVMAHRPIVRSTHGELPALIEQFADQLPGAGSDEYDAPNDGERALMGAVVEAIQDGRLDEAGLFSAPMGYEVVRYHDDTTGRDLIVLAERRPSDATRSRGWGLFVFSPDSSSTAVVEAPHPVADLSTEDLAVLVFSSADARALLVAGANRDANDDGTADVAHQEDSMFEVVHRSAVQDGGPVVQLHGFDATARSYGDAVLSSGTEVPGERIARIATSLTSEGYEVCVYDGTHCSGLGGTTNVQGSSTDEAGEDFVHIELSGEMRADATSRARIAAIIAKEL